MYFGYSYDSDNGFQSFNGLEDWFDIKLKPTKAYECGYDIGEYLASLVDKENNQNNFKSCGCGEDCFCEKCNCNKEDTAFDTLKQNIERWKMEQDAKDFMRGYKNSFESVPNIEYGMIVKCINGEYTIACAQGIGLREPIFYKFDGVSMSGVTDDVICEVWEEVELTDDVEFDIEGECQYAFGHWYKMIWERKQEEKQLETIDNERAAMLLAELGYKLDKE